MDQVHGIKIFNQLIQRSFTPSNFPMKIIKPFLGSDPLTLSQEEFNNNDIKTEEFINNDYKGKKAKKRKIETSSESEDYDEKDLVEDESDGSTKMKIAKPFLDSDPLTLSQEEFSSNNDVKTEQSFQESEEKIKSEKFDFEINDDANDIKTELAEEESEEIPVLEVRTDFFKRKGTTDRAGSSRKNKKKD